MSLKRILYLTLFPPTPGGTQYTSLETVNYLRSCGLEIDVVADPAEDDMDFDDACREEIGVQVHRLPRLPTDSSTFPPEKEVREFSAYIRELLDAKRRAGTMPDVAVAGHDKFAWYGRVLKEFGLPVVQHLMGTPTNGITLGVLPDERTKAYVRSIADADHVVCIAHHFKKLVLGLLPDWPEERISVVPSELEVSLFSPGPPDAGLCTRLELPAEARVIVHASYLRPVKRVGDIIASVPAVVRARPDAYYLLVGGASFTCDEEHIGNLASQADAFEYRDHIRMPGIVKHDELPDYLRQGEIFILSSETEGLPRAAMEAQACGLYLITSDCPGGRELAGDGALGSVYPVGDVAGLARTTLEVLNMARAKFDAIRAAARDRIVAEYAKGTQLGGYLAILKQVYDGGPA